MLARFGMVEIENEDAFDKSSLEIMVVTRVVLALAFALTCFDFLYEVDFLELMMVDDVEDDDDWIEVAVLQKSSDINF
ncbi:Hypothetical protein MVR_LOCUS99 [uncultured virus]|nr:Hypothetical protein MVR_LOCUS99 [uncultured virus]